MDVRCLSTRVTRGKIISADTWNADQFGYSRPILEYYLADRYLSSSEWITATGTISGKDW